MSNEGLIAETSGLIATQAKTPESTRASAALESLSTQRGRAYILVARLEAVLIRLRGTVPCEADASPQGVLPTLESETALLLEALSLIDGHVDELQLLI